METVKKAQTNIVGNTSAPNALLSKQGITTPEEKNLEGQLETLYVRGIMNSRKNVRLAAEEALALFKTNRGLQDQIPLQEGGHEEKQTLEAIGEIFKKHNVPLVLLKGLPALFDAMEAQAYLEDTKSGADEIANRNIETELKEQAPTGTQPATTAPAAPQAAPAAKNPMDDAIGKIMAGLDSLIATVPGGAAIDKQALSKEVAGLVSSKLTPAAKPAVAAPQAQNTQNNTQQPNK